MNAPTDDTTEDGDDLIEEFIERERSPHRDPLVRVTGLMVQYYHVCKRELWFSSRGIDIDRGAANIRRGTHIDETSYRDKLLRSELIKPRRARSL